MQHLFTYIYLTLYLFGRISDRKGIILTNVKLFFRNLNCFSLQLGYYTFLKNGNLIYLAVFLL